jgi:hypothetical protein
VIVIVDDNIKSIKHRNVGVDRFCVYVKGASVDQAILQRCFFWFGNTVADAAIAILMPTLKRFNFHGAVDWSIVCFCCESVLQKR